MQIGPISNGVANIDPYAKADSSVGGLVTVMDRDLLLNLHRAAYRSVDAVEYDQQRVTTGLDHPAAMLSNCRIDQIPSQSTKPLESSRVIQADQAE